MKEQNRDNLEHFFREGAQNYNLEFAEGDWLKLKDQLDKEMPAPPAWLNFLRRFWLVMLVFLLLPIGWLSYSLLLNKSLDDAELTGFSKNDISAVSSNSSSELLD